MSDPEMTGEELAAIRKRLGVFQDEFARRLGKNSQTISNYERGVSPIPATVARLARMIDEANNEGKNDE